MKAILNKTIGPNFRAGDVIKGDATRIKRLVNSGVATYDHSLTGMAGCVVTWIILAFIILFAISSFWTHQIDGFNHNYLAPLWRWTFIIVSIYVILKTTSQFFDNKNPYLAYFFAFSLSIIGGLLIMIGHERSTSRYQERRTSATAAISLFTVGSIAFSLGFITTWNWNVNVGGPQPWDTFEFHNFIVWVFYIFLLVVGYSLAKFFDKDYLDRRSRFIRFLQKKNATIEYKTKALNYWRAYKETGNADKFMEKNIELIEETLDIDRQQVLGEDYLSKQRKELKKNQIKNK